MRKYGLLGTVCGVMGFVTLAEAQERVRVFVQPDEFLGTIASELSANVGPHYRFDVSVAGSDSDVVQHVANDPRAIGVVQHDTYLSDMRARGAGGAHLELYGDVPACLVVVTGKGSWIRSYGDLIAASHGPAITMDVGPANGRVAHMLQALESTDPMLDRLHLDHRGGARALSRVVAGEIDTAMLLLQPHRWINSSMPVRWNWFRLTCRRLSPEGLRELHLTGHATSDSGTKAGFPREPITTRSARRWGSS
jgi:hypothetical protein